MAGFFDAGGASLFETAGMVYISYVGVTKVEPFEPTLEDLYFAVRREAREQGKAGDVE